MRTSTTTTDITDYDYTRTARNGRWEVLRTYYIIDGRTSDYRRVGERIIGSEATEGAAIRMVCALRERVFAAMNRALTVKL